jgi:hypothetical protein
MVNRASKKLFLSAMVAEADDDSGNEEEDDNTQQTNGLAMSKTELASLIRFGASAVLGGSEMNNNMSDQELDNLLERQGRDMPLPASNISNSTNDVIIEDGAQVLVASISAQEVDLRQLGNIKYTRKKSRTIDNGAINDSNMLSSGIYDDEGNESSLKRIRTSRVTMVDGTGTGYGGLVPVLSSSIDVATEKKETQSLRCSREWVY